jgi:hypothetical protein
MFVMVAPPPMLERPQLGQTFVLGGRVFWQKRQRSSCCTTMPCSPTGAPRSESCKAYCISPARR